MDHRWLNHRRWLLWHLDRYLFACRSVSAESAPVIEVDGGRMSGAVLDVGGTAVQVFRGISFAASPVVRLSHFDPCRLARPVKESCERDRERSNTPPFPSLPPPAAGWGREEGGERRSRSRLQDFSHRPGELDGVVFETKTVEIVAPQTNRDRNEVRDLLFVPR